MGKGTGFGKTILIGDQFVLEEVPAIVSAIAYETEAVVERLAGKGPEQSQILKDGPVPFNDCEVMKKWRRENGGEVL